MTETKLPSRTLPLWEERACSYAPQKTHEAMKSTRIAAARFRSVVDHPLVRIIQANTAIAIASKTQPKALETDSAVMWIVPLEFSAASTTNARTPAPARKPALRFWLRSFSGLADRVG